MYDHILKLHKKGIYHSDLKPQNIVFSRDLEEMDDSYLIKLIDLGGASVDYKDLKACSPLYFFNETSRKEANDIEFNTPEERVKAEFYALSIISM